MRKDYDSDLEKPDMWDTSKSEVRQPVKSPRVVFSVSFRKNDFDLVSKYAELSGKKTSEFIREAAIEKASPKEERPHIMFGGGSQGISWIIDQTPAYTFSHNMVTSSLQQETYPNYKNN